VIYRQRLAAVANASSNIIALKRWLVRRSNEKVLTSHGAREEHTCLPDVRRNSTFAFRNSSVMPAASADIADSDMYDRRALRFESHHGAIRIVEGADAPSSAEPNGLNDLSWHL